MGITKILADAILETDQLAVDQGGKLYVYASGKYAPLWEKHVRARVKALLLEAGNARLWSTHRASEVLEFIRVAHHSWH